MSQHEAKVAQECDDLKAAFLAEVDLDQRWELLVKLHNLGWAFRPFNHDAPFAPRRDWVAGEASSPSRPRGPVVTGQINAHAVNGAVVAVFDADLARDLAQAYATAYATCDELEQERPRWHDDVVTLFSAAALADAQAWKGPEPVMVPVVRSFRAPLRLVGGDPA